QADTGKNTATNAAAIAAVTAIDDTPRNDQTIRFMDLSLLEIGTSRQERMRTPPRTQEKHEATAGVQTRDRRWPTSKRAVLHVHPGAGSGAGLHRVRDTQVRDSGLERRRHRRVGEDRWRQLVGLD